MKMNDVRLELLSNVTEKVHLHEEIELIYVVSGSCIVYNEIEKCKLRREDFILINSGKEHCIETLGEENLICKISYSYYAMVKQIKEKFIKFMCNSTQESDIRYEKLKDMIKDILSEYGNNGKHEYNLWGKYYLIEGYLLDNFKLSSISMKDAVEMESNERMTFIRIYIQDHYEEGALLTKLSNELYMSPSSLSRYFKKKTGKNISQYVLKMRLKKIEELLIFTNNPITEIALESGFCTASSMNKSFKKYYGMTPGEYRKENQQLELQKHKEQMDLQKNQLENVIRDDIGYNKWKGNKEFVSVDTQNIIWELDKKINVINVGAASLLLNPNVQKQVLLFRKYLGIEYLRIWNVFSTQLITLNIGNAKYDFTNIDIILDFCVDNDLKPFLNMGRRCDNMLNNVKEQKTINDEIVLNEEEWIELTERFYQHICGRYDEYIIATWVIEYTFFLDTKPYYASDNYSGHKVWKKGYELVKKYIPKGKVAAPGIYMEMSQELLENALDSLWNTGYIPDIFTSCKLTLKDMENTVDLKNLNENKNFSEQISKMKAVLEKRGFRGLYCVTAWDDISINQEYVQDSCCRGCCLLSNIIDNYDKVDVLGIWYASDWANSNEGSNALLNNNGGLITKDGIYKPAWFAMWFVSRMEKYVIDRGQHYSISKNRNGDICIVCYNNTSLFSCHSARKESEKEENQLLLLGSELRLTIELNNLCESGVYVVQEEIVNEEHGSILNEWERLGNDRYLTYDDILYLKKITVPAKRKERVEVHKDSMLLNVIMQSNEMRFIIIKSEKNYNI